MGCYPTLCFWELSGEGKTDHIELRRIQKKAAVPASFDSPALKHFARVKRTHLHMREFTRTILHSSYQSCHGDDRVAGFHRVRLLDGFLCVECLLELPREIISFAFAPIVQKENARIFLRHVAVNRHDVDPVMAE